MSYYTERLAAFNAMLASGMYGGTKIQAVTGGVPTGDQYDCIPTATEYSNVMEPNMYRPDYDVVVEMRESDWKASDCLNTKGRFYLFNQFTTPTVAIQYTVVKVGGVAGREPTIKLYGKSVK